MIGIAGIVDFNNSISKNIETYNNMIHSKEKLKIENNIEFYNDNVCFIKTSGQKLVFKNLSEQSVKIAFTGEIYNKEEIANELIKKGVKSSFINEEEIILYSYLEWGIGFISKLNGAYCFSIYDSKNNQLFLVRDKVGNKPLFYTLVEDKLIFASEIKAILAYPNIKAEIDEISIAELMLIMPGRTPGYGVFKNINEVKQGEVILFTSKGLSKSTYWELQAKEHKENFKETVEHIKYLLVDSINKQKNYSKETTAFLSGGLDSSLVVALGGIKNTFSVDYNENSKYFTSSKFQPESDEKYIGIISKYLGTNHEIITLDSVKLAESLLDATIARDLPGMADVDSSMLLLCKKVKKHYDIALSGECADEIFGGYPWYRDEKIRTIDGFPWAQSTDYRASFIKPDILNTIVPKDYVYEKYIETVKKSNTLFDETALEKRMKEMYNLNIYWFMQTLLYRAETMSKQSDFIVRSPFSDHRLVEYAYNIPWEFKDYKGREKGILRTAMKDILPEDILWRKKSPYPKTHNPQYLQAVAEMLLDIISDPNSPLLNFVKKEKLEGIILEDNKTPWYGQLMTTPQTIAYFIQLNHWLKEYNVKIVSN